MPAQQVGAPVPGQAAETTAGPATPDTAALIDLLRNDAAREALIAELEKLQSGTAPAAEPPSDAQPADSAPMALVRQIAEMTQSASERAIDQVTQTWQRLKSAPNPLDGLSGQELSVLLTALRDLLVVIAGTAAVYAVLRLVVARVVRRSAHWAAEGSAGRRVLAFLAAAALSVASVALAWAAGSALALSPIGGLGQIGIRQALYLNAFLVVGLVQVVVRLILSPGTSHLRLLPMGDAAARYLSRWLGVLIAVLGYGNLVVVPIVNGDVSYVAGRAVAKLIALLVLIAAVWLVVRNRRAVARWILGEDQTGIRRTGSFASIARRWHWFALAYLAVMSVTVLTRPASAILAAFSASGKVALVLLVGIAASRWLTRGMVKGVALPDRIREPLPLLEERLNRFIPRALFVVRALILIGVAGFVLDSLGAFDARGWLDSQFGLRVTGMLFSVGSVLVVAFAIWLALTSWVDYRLNPSYGRIATPREETLLTLLRNAASIALAVITLMFVLSEVGLNIAPLLASAGVLGLAIGFGAQKLVQDIITGIFIQFENAMNVGDVVTVAGTTGVVEKLTVRSVSLRDVAGTFHIVPFSSVDMVSNFTRVFSYFVADIGVAYDADLEAAQTAMREAFDEVRADPQHQREITGDFEWFGVDSFGDSAVVLRARIRCAPGKQWSVGRAYNARVKRLFDERGIEIPFPHRTLVWATSNGGGTPAPVESGQVPDQPFGTDDQQSPSAA
ncbi:MAG: mechanosensitive ion channel [Rhodobacteraceae bacterium]|nr:mechanosensitive ion channel [Paracoccaceae bacterium]